MPNLHLTDLSVKALKGTDTNTTFWDTTTPGFGVRVGKRSKTWTVMRGRTRERISIGKYGDMSLADARAEAKRLLAAPTSDPKPVSKSVKDARDEFLTDHYDPASTSSWAHKVELILKKHLRGIEHKQVADVSDGDIRRVLDKLASTPSMQLHVYRVARTFFTWCTRSPHRYIQRSPMEGYAPPGKDRKGTRVLTEDELRSVWNAAGTGSRLVIRLMILWGTRNEETCVLRRDWASDDVLTIPGAHTKNGRDHGIPLLPLARSVLAERPNDGDFYFPGRHTNKKALNPSSLNRMLEEIQDETQSSGWTLRDIRRTFRSNMARLRVPRDVCEVLINHAPPVLDEIYDRYDRLDEKRDALARYEKFIARLVSA
ncbi:MULTISPECIES: site-specific integrase [unclassified Sphingomonas]|uniref:site-specific integrase n=1 Tax=unclassified Sphingomonas TaxID=196159 RepID=UPI002151A03A|nr:MULTISPECIES: site-specific integrase [unclassified Sphingomonas]MCR5869372.1 site-specific integrase [Sphingomonas sp. J344]UUX98898.1 site-specific integrase [Sphingomonas sp. J315]